MIGGNIKLHAQKKIWTLRREGHFISCNCWHICSLKKVEIPGNVPTSCKEGPCDRCESSFSLMDSFRILWVRLNFPSAFSVNLVCGIQCFWGLLRVVSLRGKDRKLREYWYELWGLTLISYGNASFLKIIIIPLNFFLLCSHSTFLLKSLIFWRYFLSGTDFTPLMRQNSNTKRHY